MSELRSKLIRLAHAKPELRGALLPLLAKAAAADKKIKGKKLESVVSDAYYKHFDRVQVNMMDIGKIYGEAEKAYNGAATHAEGLEALDKAMAAAVPKYKKNASQSKRTAASVEQQERFRKQNPKLFPKPGTKVLTRGVFDEDWQQGTIATEAEMDRLKLQPSPAEVVVKLKGGKFRKFFPGADNLKVAATSQSKRTAALTVRVDDLSLNGFQVAYLSEVAGLISQDLGGWVEPMEESVTIGVPVNDKGDESRISLNFRGADLIATFDSYNEELSMSTPRGETKLPYAQITHMRLQAVATIVKRSSLIK